jgi:hypothetical protein
MNMPPAPDSEPAPPATLPLGSGPGDAALWDDGDTLAPNDLPAAPVSAPAPPTRNGPVATIGHIGRYALKHQLGEGGLGTVYAAHDPLLSRLIAVKTLHVEVEPGEREAFNALFLDEARAAAGLSHPHIVTVFDAGVSDDRAYIAMELLKGRDLRQLREEGWRPTPAQAALIARRVADALGYAHGKGVVHRDVKPANIFMIGRTQPKVLDFGIARVAHRHDPHGRKSDVAAGSPYYMAPEQIRQESVDRRADVFSLGVVLYELLTGVKPFRGATLEEITRAVLEHDPPPADRIDPAVPPALAAITAQALAKDPAERHRSARAFARELRHWLDDNAVGTEQALPPALPTRRWAVPPSWIAAVLAPLALGAVLWAILRDPSVLPADHPDVADPLAAAALPAAAIEPASVATPVPAAPLNPPPAATTAALSSVPVLDAPSPAATAAAATSALPASAGSAASASAAKSRTTRVGAEAKERDRRNRARDLRSATAAPAAAAAPLGVVRLAVSPWGEVEVDGKPAGTAPPLTELNLAQGPHQIVIRNADLPPHVATLDVIAGQSVSLKHKF